MRRIMCVWLPQLPLDRRVRLGDPRVDGQFAIIAEIKNAFRLTHLSARAREAGLTPGMSVPDARAVAPDLLTEPADPVREDLLLKSVTRWASSLSPWIAPITPDSLVLDISGCAHLFGGERAMGKDTAERLSGLQITSSIGIADTKGAARALARFGRDLVTIAAPGQTRQAMTKLPIMALNIPVALAHDLRRTGLKTIGQLYSHKSSELARRFGLDLPQVLAKTLGHVPDPVSPQDPEQVFAARMNLPNPLGLKEDIMAVLERLCASVCTRLSSAQMGGRQFSLTVRCVDSGDHVIRIGFAAPTHDQDVILRQFTHPLDKLKLDYGADWFRLVADRAEPLQIRQGQIVSEDDAGDKDISALITTLGNRLGFHRVCRFLPGDSHLPDYEFTTVEAVAPFPDMEWPEESNRPLRLYRPERLRTLTPGRPPQKFEWRQGTYETLSASGPERLYPEWWRGNVGGIRDYWQVVTASGDRLWLLTYPGSDRPDWYVSGTFG